jgi:hypothetical protein
VSVRVREVVREGESRRGLERATFKKQSLKVGETKSVCII